MPNARPTQPGYYWAKVGPRWWRSTPVSWHPVELVLLASGDYTVATTYTERPIPVDEVIEWGPAIPEYRGEGGG